MEEFI